MLRSPILLAALADAAVPAMRPVKVEGLAVPAGAVYQTAHVTGQDGRVWVVRSALTGAAGAELAASDALVQLLAGRVPFSLPRVEGVARPKNGPAVAVYAGMRGQTLDWSDLSGRSDAARAVGVALAELHGVDARIVEEAGLPSYDADTYRQRLLADLDRAAATNHVPSSLLSRWEQALEAPALWRFSTVVTHGPLHGEDVIVDEGEVSGISGWEHAGVADPARDFCLLWNHAPRQAFDTVYEAYAAHRRERPDQNLERRIRLMGEMCLASSLLHSRTMGEEALVEFHASALRTLALEVEDDTSLMPPVHKGGIMPMELDAIDPDDIESVGQGDLTGEEETTVEIPVHARRSGSDSTAHTDHPSATTSPSGSPHPSGATRVDATRAHPPQNEPDHDKAPEQPGTHSADDDVDDIFR